MLFNIQIAQCIKTLLEQFASAFIMMLSNFNKPKKLNFGNDSVVELLSIYLRLLSLFETVEISKFVIKCFYT